MNVSIIRKDSPMLPVGVRNESYLLDDAFDELLHWASTDDADRWELDLLGLAGGLRRAALVVRWGLRDPGAS